MAGLVVYKGVVCLGHRGGLVWAKGPPKVWCQVKAVRLQKREDADEPNTGVDKCESLDSMLQSRGLLCSSERGNRGLSLSSVRHRHAGNQTLVH